MRSRGISYGHTWSVLDLSKLICLKGFVEYVKKVEEMLQGNISFVLMNNLLRPLNYKRQTDNLLVSNREIEDTCSMMISIEAMEEMQSLIRF